MKYFWWPLANTIVMLFMFMYVGITKDINTKALDKCEKLQKELELQEKRVDYLSDLVGRKDTIVINVKNYNYYKK